MAFRTMDAAIPAKPHAECRYRFTERTELLAKENRAVGTVISMCEGLGLICTMDQIWKMAMESMEFRAGRAESVRDALAIVEA